VFDLFFILSFFSFSAFCFFEIIVFDEESLLALCFFSFVFFMFNNVGNSIFDTLTSRAVKFESDLLHSFSFEKTNIQKNFNNFLLSLNFTTKFSILLSLLVIFLSLCGKNVSFKLESSLFSQSFSQLTMMSLTEKKFVSFLQKKSVSVLLYPLIFQTSKKTAKSLVTFVKPNNNNLLNSILKSLTI
jgi:hypothetical protein